MITLGMPKERKEKWRKNFLKAIEKLYESGKISRATYYDVKRICEDKDD